MRAIFYFNNQYVKKKKKKNKNEIWNNKKIKLKYVLT